MLWDASALKGYEINATDGVLGTVSDLLFEDVSWTVRWLVVDTGNWLPGRKVLLPFDVLGRPDRELFRFPVRLTRQQVKDSPDVDTDRTVSRQMEFSLYDYYGLDAYWGGGLYPLSNDMALPFRAPPPPSDTELRDEIALESRPARGDPHLRGVSAVTGYHMHATDGEIGHVADFLVDDSDWTIRYLAVATGNWWVGERVLISPHSVSAIDWLERMIDLKLDRAKIKSSPPFRPGMTVDGAYLEQFNDYYGL